MFHRLIYHFFSTFRADIPEDIEQGDDILDLNIVNVEEGKTIECSFMKSNDEGKI